MLLPLLIALATDSRYRTPRELFTFFWSGQFCCTTSYEDEPISARVRVERLLCKVNLLLFCFLPLLIASTLPLSSFTCATLYLTEYLLAFMQAFSPTKFSSFCLFSLDSLTGFYDQTTMTCGGRVRDRKSLQERKKIMATLTFNITQLAWL